MNQQNPSGEFLADGLFYMVNWGTNPLEVPDSITQQLPEGIFALVPISNLETVDAQSMLAIMPITLDMPSENSSVEFSGAMMPFENEATSLTMLQGFNEGGQNDMMVQVQTEETPHQEHSMASMDLTEGTGPIQTYSGIEQIDRAPQQAQVAAGSVNRRELNEMMVQGEAAAQEGGMDLNQGTGTGSVQMELSSGMDQAPQQAQNVQVPTGSVKRRPLYEMHESEAKTPAERKRIRKAKNSKAYNDRIKREAERYENLDRTVVKQVIDLSDEVIDLLHKMNAQEDEAEKDRIWDEEIKIRAPEFEQLKNKLFPPDQ